MAFDIPCLISLIGDFVFEAGSMKIVEKTDRGTNSLVPYAEGRVKFCKKCAFFLAIRLQMSTFAVDFV